MHKQSLILFCKCTAHQNKRYCIRLDKFDERPDWEIAVAFPSEPEMERDYGGTPPRIHARVTTSKKYNGCPYCSTKILNFCSKCGNVFDTFNVGKATCPWCNVTDIWSPASEFDFNRRAF